MAVVSAATVFFVLAINQDVYNSTSPPAITWHVLLRKIYSVAAFTIVGFLFLRARGEYGKSRSLGTGMLAVALYSALIEIAQFAIGVREGLVWNAVDVTCGALGGALGFVISAKRA
ncbi:MAG: VanZ family protein [Candidatus Eremiobacteraeota bacterium]|nr:VanZ family protein [Candidatus Eremiobacteraeota bacterium]